MATCNFQTTNLLSPTDCMYFTNGFCMFKGKCHYRHCQAALKQLAKCPNWPDSCRNMACPYRHIGSSMKESKPLIAEKVKVSFYWDIENVPIPRGQKPFDIVQRIRDKFVTEPGFQEIDFCCYCDIYSIPQENQSSLHHATVRMVHVPDRKPGGADRQIMLDLDRFERIHKPPATIVLISGDIDFVGKLSDLRHQAGFHVIVIHNRPAKQELKATVNEHYPWESFTDSSPKQMPQPVLNDRVNNDCDTDRTTSSEFKRSLLKQSFNSASENNPVEDNDSLPKCIESNQRNGSVVRKRRSKNHTKPPTAFVIPSFDQTSASDTEIKTPPSGRTSVVKPRSRMRRTISTDQLSQSNNLRNDPIEPKVLTNNDDTTKTQQKLLRCPFCTDEFSIIKALRQHQKDKNHLFVCLKCNEDFPTREGQRQHQNAKHSTPIATDKQSIAVCSTIDGNN